MGGPCVKIDHVIIGGRHSKMFSGHIKSRKNKETAFVSAYFRICYDPIGEWLCRHPTDRADFRLG